MIANLACEGWLELARAWCELRDSNDQPEVGEEPTPGLAADGKACDSFPATTATSTRT